MAEPYKENRVMNKTTVSIQIPQKKRRAIELFASDSPYRPRVVPNKKGYDRNKVKQRDRQRDG